jgi:hypothetical protein
MGKTSSYTSEALPLLASHSILLPLRYERFTMCPAAAAWCPISELWRRPPAPAEFEAEPSHS